MTRVSAVFPVQTTERNTNLLWILRGGGTMLCLSRGEIQRCWHVTSGDISGTSSRGVTDTGVSCSYITRMALQQIMCAVYSVPLCMCVCGGYVRACLCVCVRACVRACFWVWCVSNNRGPIFTILETQVSLGQGYCLKNSK